jgi:hypothetical protein
MQNYNMKTDIRRIEANYAVLNRLYKQGKFEDEVIVAEDANNSDKFYFADKLKIQQKFIFSNKPPLGKKRNSRDLQWATRNLREQVQHSIENYEQNSSVSVESVGSLVTYTLSRYSLCNSLEPSRH